MDNFSSAAQKTFQQLGGRMNEITGYHEIETLKRLVTENERKMHEIREEAKASKAAYEEAVARRSNSQRETNELLQRKSTWTEADVMRFTQLVRADHLHSQDEARAKARVAEADAVTERQFAELMRSILSRYHEEQVWSDKIRSASTYGSLAALGLNLLVFILAIVLVEPWKRKRLVQSFERRVIELNEANQRVVEEGLKELRVHQEKQEDVLAEIRAAQALVRESGERVPTLRDEGEGVDATVTESVPGIEVERGAKSSRDRQIMALSAASAIGAGIVGFMLGSWFS
ncbi:uncharacterized protein FOMMEDRAFT_129892 [Fomitiporia mediterranea MF3/22]|uniref:uncharacterized protein n=1 Tax=Fomitiporia mediterranea (strain MF3/22) TaxID=694068 RepID=UPI0004409B10|nr:uncharacterized protein FOMMEDRAFT_129892 [Fomitiporia mediterranea MF3/22]EJC97970.1 hypothetical protein FOMMEDRAFT_129892 [Fomitiporia mediterranea MF3/22]